MNEFISYWRSNVLCHRLLLIAGEWHLLKVSVVLELRDWVEGHQFPVHADDTGCLWCVGKHAT